MYICQFDTLIAAH